MPTVLRINGYRFYFYEYFRKGIGVHWPDLDEDLSLKGFLQEEIIRSVEHVLGKTA